MGPEGLCCQKLRSASAKEKNGRVKEGVQIVYGVMSAIGCVWQSSISKEASEAISHSASLLRLP